MSKLSIEINVPEGIDSKEFEAKFVATATRIILEQTVLRLYRDGEISLGTGAHMLGMTVADFISLTGRHRVSIFHYEDKELEAEMSNARERQQ
ncbi:MAG: UPF0175 family protein [Acidobacteriota bacterium]|nr:UPF0175 family protein [Acidobacteriota bacterium]